MSANKVLGKGLSALIGESKIDFLINNNSSTKDLIDIKLLTVGKYQPRKIFNEKNLEELSESIKTNGVISPIIVREIASNQFEIIAGERRWRASKLAGLKKVPVIIRELSDKQALEFAIIENIQRQDLNLIEEAAGYQRLIDEFGYTQEQLSNALGKSRSHIANFLRILSLPADVKEMINNGDLSMGHAKALVTSQSPESFAKEIVINKMTVRQAEKLVKGDKDFSKKTNAVKSTPRIRNFDESYDQENIITEKNHNADLAQIEDSLSNILGYKVSIEQKQNANKVIIHFNKLEQLDNILQKFNKM